MELTNKKYVNIFKVITQTLSAEEIICLLLQYNKLLVLRILKISDFIKV